MKTKYSLKWILFILLFPLSVQAQSPGITSRDIFTPVKATNGMVVTSDPVATRAGVEVLERGGNAVDAAVTVGFVLAVTLPRAGNIGGGGFMLVRDAETKDMIAIDYRETAPAKARQFMFLDETGEVDTLLSRYSHLSAGVPGTVAGLALALEKYGTISLNEALRPAIRLAKKGFPLSDKLSGNIEEKKWRLSRWEAARKIFMISEDQFYQPGDLLVQKDLAKTLKKIARQGPRSFYEGEISERIVREMERRGGIITREDLAAYQPVIRKPVHGAYRGFDIYSIPPPGSGGVHIVQMLNVLEGFDLKTMGHNSASAIHLMAKAMKHAYADRAKYMGDPDFFPVPVEGLTSKAYADSVRQNIKMDSATPASGIGLGAPPGYEGPETTHFSIIDKNGNMVANTYTLNFSFGSGIVVEGTGFLLNNEMDDFSSKPGVPNAYGLIGGRANAIEPGKRMLSSMSPAFVLKDGKPFLITGSPGGSRIITSTLQVILNVIEFGMNIQEAVNAPRIHHQWLPDYLRIEESISPDTIEKLESMGHVIRIKSTMGITNSILIDPETGMKYGAADPRNEDGLAAGY